MKQIYKIHQGYIANGRLYGFPDKSDSRFFDDELIRTSSIVSREEDVVETRNSVYEVMSWLSGIPSEPYRG